MQNQDEERILSIVRSPSGSRMPTLAEQLAVDTNLSSNDAIRLLIAAGEDHDRLVAEMKPDDASEGKARRTALAHAAAAGSRPAADAKEPDEPKSSWGKAVAKTNNEPVPQNQADGWGKAKSFLKTPFAE